MHSRSLINREGIGTIGILDIDFFLKNSNVENLCLQNIQNRVLALSFTTKITISWTKLLDIRNNSQLSFA